MQFPNLYKIAAFALAVVLIIVLLGNGCGKQNTAQLDQLQAARDSLIAYQTEKGFFEVRANQDSVTIEALKRDTATARQALRDRDKYLTGAQKTAVRLAGELADARARKDTLRYKSKADSLEMAAIYFSDQVNKARKEVRDVQLYADSLLFAKDEQIGDLIAQLLNCDRALKTAGKAIDKAIPAVKPRSAVYIGAEVQGGKADPLNGVLGKVALLNKRGQLFTIGAGRVNAETQFTAGILFRLSFKKR